MGSRCEVVTRMETLSYGSVGWKPLVWVCHVLYYFPIETRGASQRSPICRGAHMYGSTHIRTWVHLHACVRVFIQVCTAGKMGSRCEVVTRMETLSYGSVDGNPSYGSVTGYVTSQVRPGRPHRSPICRGVHMYVSTHVHTWVDLYACVWVGLGKLHG